MKDMNKVLLIGRLGTDPLKRTTAKGTSVVHFPMATSKRIRRAETSPDLEADTAPIQESTQWHQVVVWGKMGENCHKYLHKGSPVFVEGEIRSHQYESKEGQERTSFEVVASDVGFLGLKRSRDGTNVNESAAQVAAG